MKSKAKTDPTHPGNKKFWPGDKVMYLPEQKLYDFGYYSQEKGVIVIYEEGCRNMQDSYAVDEDKLLRINK